MAITDPADTRKPSSRDNKVGLKSTSCAWAGVALLTVEVDLTTFHGLYYVSDPPEDDAPDQDAEAASQFIAKIDT